MKIENKKRELNAIHFLRETEERFCYVRIFFLGRQDINVHGYKCSAK